MATGNITVTLRLDAARWSERLCELTAAARKRKSLISRRLELAELVDDGLWYASEAMSWATTKVAVFAHFPSHLPDD